MKRHWWLSLLLTAASLAASPWQDEVVLRDSLSRVHPRMRASWLKEHGLDDSYYTTFRKPDSQGLREVGRWSFGPSYDVDGRVTPTETLVALARGSGVSLIRFSRADSLQLELLSDINAPGLLNRVWLRDTLLYVGSAAGLEIWSIADERNPARLSWIQTALNDFDVQDSLAYVIGADDSFKVYNVSNPANPVFRGACRDSGDLVSVAGNTAFVGDRWGLYVMDVSNPASPHRIGSWGSSIEQVQARGTLCYVTTTDESGKFTFRILDVSVPASPAQLGAVDSAGGDDVYLADTLAFGVGDRLTIVSVADSTRPRLVGSAAKPGWSMGIWADGLVQSAFAACHFEGLQVYDTRNTLQPVRDTGLLGSDAAVDIAVDGGKAYVAEYLSGLQILDVSVPSLPVFLGAYDSGQTVRAATARDSFAFASWPRPRMLSIDVADPTQPAKAGGCENMFNPPEAMVIRDSFVYCAEASRLQIVNIARPREPMLVGNCFGDGVAIVVRDSFAYTAAGAIRITNIARPDSPFVVSTIGRASRNLQLLDTVLVCAPGPVMWFDVADPTAPAQVDSIDLGHSVYGLTAVDTIVYASTAGNLLYAISIADLHGPRILSQTTLPYTANRIVYAGSRLYLTCWEAGVCIFETASVGLHDADEPTPLATWLAVRPNPARSQCEVEGRWKSGGSIIVRDVAGRTVLVPSDRSKSAGKLTLDLSKLKAGVYFLDVKDKEARMSVKLVKQ
jgi:hypothetical protein